MAQERLTTEKEFYETTVSGSSNRLDLFKEYYESVTTNDKRNAYDTFKQFLVEQGMTSNNTTDMWKAYLEGEGYSGHILDMERQYFIDNS